MGKKAFATLLLSLALAAPARADLPKGFNWDDEAVWAAARHDSSVFSGASPKERARLVGILLMCPDQSAGFGSQPKPGNLMIRGYAALDVLQQASDLDRFRTLRLLDRKGDQNIRQIYETLDESGQAKLLELAKMAGKAGTDADEQQLGVVSDNDDTAFPTQYKPDGIFGFKGAEKFYKKLIGGEDGTGDSKANMHYLSARAPFLHLNSRLRLIAADLPNGTFDFQTDPGDAFRGLDGIQDSKIKNLDLWMKLHPGQKFVLLGDTIQRDPEVYRWALANHPDQVAAVMIHRAGANAVRKPEDYKGEIFFDDYTEALDIATTRGIIKPGAKAPAAIDPNGLPLPNTDVSGIKYDHGIAVAGDFVVETVASTGKAIFVNGIGHGFGHIFKGMFGGGDKKPSAPIPMQPRTGMTQALEQNWRTDVPPQAASDPAPQDRKPQQHQSKDGSDAPTPNDKGR